MSNRPLFNLEGRSDTKIWQSVSTQEAERNLLLDELRERVKELTALQATSRLLQDERLSTAELVQRIASLLPSAWQRPATTCARIAVDGIEAQTPGFHPAPSMLRAEFTTGTGGRGVLEIALREAPADTQGAFLSEEQQLLESVAEILRLHFDRRAAEEALRESETRFRQLAEHVPNVFWVAASSTGEAIYVSPAYERVFRRSCDSLYHDPLSWLEAVHPGDVERIRNQITQGDVAELDFRIVWPDGTIRWLEARSVPVRDAGGQVYRLAGTTTDITDRKLLEEQLRQAQKMEAVGRLAGGVAHDFNNMLTIIIGYSDVLLNSLHKEDPLRELVAEVDAAAQRAAGITHQLLVFSRKQVLDPRPVDLGAVVSDMDRMLRRLIGEDVVLVTRSARDVGLVQADRGQLEQVIVNLAVNAHDAMPAGGELTIVARNVDLSEAEVRGRPEVHPGPYMLLSVTDTGYGMDAQTQQRIFEPFFTTKEPGKGTGLGLATVYGIVQQSGGHLAVVSELGRGTTFKIYLPRVEIAALDEGTDQPAALQRGGDETILLVEDEDAVRALALHILERNGYTVLEACHGGEALAISDAHPGPIDLLVTDVVMPGMSGRRLADRLAQRRPQIKVIYLSGYTDEAIGQRGVLEPGMTLIQKPFTPHTLTCRVRAALDCREALVTA